MLSCVGLTKSFGGLVATRDVSLHVPAGERHGIIGPNGAGKTTLFNLISGELQPDRGQVKLGGVEITRLPPDGRARRGLARSFQRSSGFPEMTVAQNLAVAAALAAKLQWQMFGRLTGNREVRARVVELAEMVGVDDVLEAPIAHLSYGTQRQVEIGMALASGPRLLLLDEPTAGMSPQETDRISALIAALPGELTLVVIEHDMDFLLSLVDRVTVLDRGSVLAQGTPSDMRASPLVQDRYLGVAS